MSHIEKEKLIKADIASIENRVRHAFNQGYDLGFKDGKEKAKPLEQEPVIDKIIAEIENYKLSEDELSDMDEDSVKWGMKIACDLVDKYKAESK